MFGGLRVHNQRNAHAAEIGLGIQATHADCTGDGGQLDGAGWRPTVTQAIGHVEGRQGRFGTVMELEAFGSDHDQSSRFSATHCHKVRRQVQVFQALACGIKSAVTAIGDKAPNVPVRPDTDSLFLALRVAQNSGLLPEAGLGVGGMQGVWHMYGFVTTTLSEFEWSLPKSLQGLLKIPEFAGALPVCRCQNKKAHPFNETYFYRI